MLNNFLNMFQPQKKWHLRPLRHPKDSEENYSSKALLPHYILEDLVEFDVQPPYIFQISHNNGLYKTACSVLDFQLETSEIHVPTWMFEQLSLDPFTTIAIEPIKSIKGTGIKLLPHSVDFLSIESPKKELELALKNYHVLSAGDEILLNFEDIGRCRFTVTKIIPEDADSIYIVDTDLNVDFDEPIGYKEKIENEKSVLKYIDIIEENGVKILKCNKDVLFIDWKALKTD